MNKIKKIINLIVDFYQTLLISCISKNNKFSYIYKSKYWKGAGEGSLSGAGSNENTMQKIKHELQSFFSKKRFNQYSIYHVVTGNGCLPWIFNK